MSAEENEIQYLDHNYEKKKKLELFQWISHSYGV